MGLRIKLNLRVQRFSARESQTQANDKGLCNVERKEVHVHCNNGMERDGGS